MSQQIPLQNNFLTPSLTPQGQNRPANNTALTINGLSKISEHGKPLRMQDKNLSTVDASIIQGRKVDSPKIYVKEINQRPQTSAQASRKSRGRNSAQAYNTSIGAKKPATGKITNKNARGSGAALGTLPLKSPLLNLGPQSNKEIEQRKFDFSVGLLAAQAPSASFEAAAKKKASVKSKVGVAASKQTTQAKRTKNAVLKNKVSAHEKGRKTLAASSALDFEAVGILNLSNTAKMATQLFSVNNQSTKSVRDSRQTATSGKQSNLASGPLQGLSAPVNNFTTSTRMTRERSKSQGKPKSQLNVAMAASRSSYNEVKGSAENFFVSPGVTDLERTITSPNMVSSFPKTRQSVPTVKEALKKPPSGSQADKSKHTKRTSGYEKERATRSQAGMTGLNANLSKQGKHQRNKSENKVSSSSVPNYSHAAGKKAGTTLKNSSLQIKVQKTIPDRKERLANQSLCGYRHPNTVSNGKNAPQNLSLTMLESEPIDRKNGRKSGQKRSTEQKLRNSGVQQLLSGDNAQQAAGASGKDNFFTLQKGGQGSSQVSMRNSKQRTMRRVGNLSGEGKRKVSKGREQGDFSISSMSDSSRGGTTTTAHNKAASKQKSTNLMGKITSKNYFVDGEALLKCISPSQPSRSPRGDSARENNNQVVSISSNAIQQQRNDKNSKALTMRSKSTGAHRHYKGVAPSTHKASEDPGRLTLDSDLATHNNQLRYSGKNNKSQLGELHAAGRSNATHNTATIDNLVQQELNHEGNRKQNNIQASSNSHLNLSSRLNAKSKHMDKLIKRNIRQKSKKNAEEMLVKFMEETQRKLRQKEILLRNDEIKKANAGKQTSQGNGVEILPEDQQKLQTILKAFREKKQRSKSCIQHGSDSVLQQHQSKLREAAEQEADLKRGQKSTKNADSSLNKTTVMQQPLMSNLDRKKFAPKDKNCVIELSQLKREVDNEIRRDRRQGRIELLASKNPANRSAIVRSSSTEGRQSRKFSKDPKDPLAYTQLRSKDPSLILAEQNLDDGNFKARIKQETEIGIGVEYKGLKAQAFPNRCSNLNTSKIQRFIEKQKKRKAVKKNQQQTIEHEKYMRVQENLLNLHKFTVNNRLRSSAQNNSKLLNFSVINSKDRGSRLRDKSRRKASQLSRDLDLEDENEKQIGRRKGRFDVEKWRGGSSDRQDETSTLNRDDHHDRTIINVYQPEGTRSHSSPQTQLQSRSVSQSFGRSESITSPETHLRQVNMAAPLRVLKSKPLRQSKDYTDQAIHTHQQPSQAVNQSLVSGNTHEGIFNSLDSDKQISSGTGQKKKSHYQGHGQLRVHNLNRSSQHGTSANMSEQFESIEPAPKRENSDYEPHIKPQTRKSPQKVKDQLSKPVKMLNPNTLPDSSEGQTITLSANKGRARFSPPKVENLQQPKKVPVLNLDVVAQKSLEAQKLPEASKHTLKVNNQVQAPKVNGGLSARSARAYNLDMDGAQSTGRSIFERNTFREFFSKQEGKLAPEEISSENYPRLIKIREDAIAYQHKKTLKQIDSQLKNSQISPRTFQRKNLELESWVTAEQEEVKKTKKAFEEEWTKTTKMLANSSKNYEHIQRILSGEPLQSMNTQQSQPSQQQQHQQLTNHNNSVNSQVKAPVSDRGQNQQPAQLSKRGEKSHLLSLIYDKPSDKNEEQEVDNRGNDSNREEFFVESESAEADSHRRVTRKEFNLEQASLSSRSSLASLKRLEQEMLNEKSPSDKEEDLLSKITILNPQKERNGFKKLILNSQSGKSEKQGPESPECEEKAAQKEEPSNERRSNVHTPSLEYQSQPSGSVNPATQDNSYIDKSLTKKFDEGHLNSASSKTDDQEKAPAPIDPDNKDTQSNQFIFQPKSLEHKQLSSDRGVGKASPFRSNVASKKIAPKSPLDGSDSLIQPAPTGGLQRVISKSRLDADPIEDDSDSNQGRQQPRKQTKLILSQSKEPAEQELAGGTLRKSSGVRLLIDDEDAELARQVMEVSPVSQQSSSFQHAEQNQSSQNKAGMDGDQIGMKNKSGNEFKESIRSDHFFLSKMNQSQGTSEEDLHRPQHLLADNADSVQNQLQQLTCEPTVSPHGLHPNSTTGINLNTSTPISAASGQQPGSKIKIEIGGQQMDEAAVQQPSSVTPNQLNSQFVQSHPMGMKLLSGAQAEAVLLGSTSPLSQESATMGIKMGSMSLSSSNSKDGVPPGHIAYTQLIPDTVDRQPKADITQASVDITLAQPNNDTTSDTVNPIFDMTTQAQKTNNLQIDSDLKQSHMENEQILTEKNRFETTLSPMMVEQGEQLVDEILESLLTEVKTDKIDLLVNREFQRQQELREQFRKQGSGIKTDLFAIEGYVDEVHAEVEAKKELFLKNLYSPIDKDQLKFLNQLQNSEIGSCDHFDENYPQVLPLDLYLTLEKRRKEKKNGKKAEGMTDVAESDGAGGTGTGQLVKQSDQEEQLKSFLAECEHIHNKVLFDCINDSLLQFKPYGKEGPPMLWSRQARRLKPTDDFTIGEVFEIVKHDLFKWAITVAGTLPRREFIYQGVFDEELFSEIREKKLVQLLAREMIETEPKWLNYEFEQTQVKIDVGDMILEQLVNETIGILAQNVTKPNN